MANYTIRTVVPKDMHERGLEADMLSGIRDLSLNAIRRKGVIVESSIKLDIADLPCCCGSDPEEGGDFPQAHYHYDLSAMIEDIG